MSMPIRNGVDPRRHFVGTTLRNLAEFHQRVVNDSTGLRANADFERTKLANPRVAAPDRDHLVAVVRILQDAPDDLLQFTRNQADALRQLMDWGNELRKFEEPSFLGDITPRAGDCRTWDGLVKAGYFN